MIQFNAAVFLIGRPENLENFPWTWKKTGLVACISVHALLRALDSSSSANDMYRNNSAQ